MPLTGIASNKLQGQPDPLLVPRRSERDFSARQTLVARPLRLRSELDEDACFQRESKSKSLRERSESATPSNRASAPAITL